MKQKIKMMNNSITIVVPVYNEILLLEQSITLIVDFMEKHFTNYEIILIESGSTDGSSEMCNKLASTFSKVMVIHEGKKAGFGSALKLGYKTATKDLVWTITVDLPFSLEVIFTALPLFSQYDCVLSYRTNDKRDSLRKIRSFVYNLIAKKILNLKVKHVNSAFKVFKRQVIQNLNLVSLGWAIDAEIVYEISRRHIRYTDLPVDIIDRTKGKSYIMFSDPFKMIGELIAIRTK
ncbi:MAG: glycosyltransferase family 2 protein [Anaerolineales bacterium]|nr:glycosyltransferase family 2 protein [Anaerolineales bacterium]